MKKIKFNDLFFENEKNGLLVEFPQLANPDEIYHVVDGMYYANDEMFGITKIRAIGTGELFDIDELKHKRINQHLEYWAFVVIDDDEGFGVEFEVVE